MESNNHQVYPLISIVITTYNGEKFLKQQLDSLVAQDYPQIEIIAVDDCSTDQTFKVLQDYATKYPFFKAYLNEKNLGLNKNFEKGLLLAQGEYIAISDQDDIWKKEKISTLIQEIGNYTMVYHDSELIDSNGSALNKKLSEINQLGDFNTCLNFTIATRVPGHTMLFRKELVAKCIPFPKPILYDHWMAFVASCDTAIKFVPQALVSYRQHANNTFGADFVKRPNQSKKKKQPVDKNWLAKERLQLLYHKCPSTLTKEKNVLAKLLASYESLSLKNNFRRMILFFKYNHLFLAHKKYGQFRKWLYCLKAFFKMP